MCSFRDFDDIGKIAHYVAGQGDESSAEEAPFHVGASQIQEDPTTGSKLGSIFLAHQVLSLQGTELNLDL